MYKKIELIANIAIIVVALLLGVVLVKRYLLPGSSQPEHASAESQLRAGTKLSLPDVDWEKNQRTLVMVLSETCHFCTESAPFYQRIAQQREGKENIRLVAVLPQEVEQGREYVSSLGLKVDDVRQAAPPELGVRGTPTLILTDAAGVITNSWVGKLPADKESEVLSKLQ